MAIEQDMEQIPVPGNRVVVKTVITYVSQKLEVSTIQAEYRRLFNVCVSLFGHELLYMYCCISSVTCSMKAKEGHRSPEYN